MRASTVFLLLGLIAWTSAHDGLAGPNAMSFSDDSSVNLADTVGSDMFELGYQKCTHWGCCLRNKECCGAFCCERGRETGFQLPCHGEMGHPAM